MDSATTCRVLVGLIKPYETTLQLTCHGSTTVNHLPDYMQSLYRTRDVLDQFASGDSPLVIYPAHGLEVVESRKKVQEYIENRLDRITKTANYLLSQPADIWIPECDILHAVYPEVPGFLHEAALLNLRHSLFWIQSAHTRSPTSSGPRVFGLVARFAASSREITMSEFTTLINAYEDSLFSHDRKPPRILTSRWEWKRSTEASCD